jgi:hypothetical protein
VILEQIGQLAGVTTYLHVYMEPSISTVEAQLLKQNCGTKLVVLNYMMTYVNASHYRDKPEDLPEGSMVRQNAKLWYNVARLHLRDLDDMENEVTT